MNRPLSRISIEQVGAFVELARCGSLRAASAKLCLSEEGLRSRILVLEERLGASLYEKERGRRGEVRLTRAGCAFLDKATRFMQEARALTEPIEPPRPAGETRVAVSQHLALYPLIDIARKFRAQFPGLSVRIATRTEQELVSALRTDAGFDAGICAAEDCPADLDCQRWFSMGWQALAPPGHPLLRRPSVALAELAGEPLVVFRTDSGRQHVPEAFQRRGLSPRIIAEVACAHAAGRLVEAGMGIAIVPSLAASVLADDMKLGRAAINDSIHAVDSVILTRSASRDDTATQTFLNYLLHYAVPGLPDDRLAATGMAAGPDAASTNLRRDGRPDERRATGNESRGSDLRRAASR